MDKPSRISKLLKKSTPSTQGLLERGEYLNRLNRLLGKYLDSDTKLHCQIGNVRDGILIIYTDSTAWASRLRYQIPQLIKQLQQEKAFTGLKSIEMKVLPKAHKEENTRKAELSEEASTCLQGCAAGVADEGLKEALLRLASHQKDKDIK